MSGNNLEKIYAEIEETMFGVSKILMKELMTNFDQTLSANQQHLLYLIASKEGCTVKEFADELDISSSAVSQMLSKLEELKMIKRSINKENRRNIKIELDTEGKRIFELMMEKRNEMYQKYISKMSEDDLKVFLNALINFKNIILEEQEKINK